ncbi:MAG TPA: GvpL/GvpF family gas vesicle protein [Candidatus Angelobacter sp.]|nr:GvpL/GvpF family gas vesicle protein [Candidatus Angelobacter sp.]
MNRVLAYCGFLDNARITTPQTGVGKAQVNVIAEKELRLLWSEVAWPFEQSELQRSAMDFHAVIQHVFEQTAVVPFRLLSIFDDVAALTKFAAEHGPQFIADLERLRGYVQMESVVYVIAGRAPADTSSGRAYLQQKAEALRRSSENAARVKTELAAVSEDVHIREVKNGTRIFALVQRGDEERFRRIVESVPVEPPVSRRVSGPWPAAEFLSAAVKSPRIAGQP